MPRSADFKKRAYANQSALHIHSNAAMKNILIYFNNTILFTSIGFSETKLVDLGYPTGIVRATSSRDDSNLQYLEISSLAIIFEITVRKYTFHDHHVRTGTPARPLAWIASSIFSAQRPISIMPNRHHRPDGTLCPHDSTIHGIKHVRAGPAGSKSSLAHVMIKAAGAS